MVGFEALGSACRAYSFTQCNFLATSGISSPSSFSEGEPRNVFFLSMRHPTSVNSTESQRFSLPSFHTGSN